MKRSLLGLSFLAATAAACTHDNTAADASSPGPDVAVTTDTGTVTPEASVPDAAVVANDGSTTDASDAGRAGDAAVGDGAVAFAPDDYCPGRPHCVTAPDAGVADDNQLYVGVAKALINPPTPYEHEWTDTNGNHEYDRGEAFVDLNGNHVFDAVWIAGFGNARPAIGSDNDLEVRAIAFKYNGVTVGLAAIDCVGYFITDMDAIRADPQLAGLDVDKIIISATHVHEAVDTIGIWGPDTFTTGLNPTYMALTHTRAAQALHDALTHMQPARMRIAQVPATDSSGSTMNYVNDTRDPVIYDPTLTVMRFTQVAHPDVTIGTWVNFAAHPEFSGSRNNLLSADYPHHLRDVVENGVQTGPDTAQGIGGITVFQNGPLGGQVGPGGGVHPLDDNGTPITESSLDKARAEGRRLGRLALAALAGTNAHDETVDRIVYRTVPLTAEVDNAGYQAFFLSGVFARPLTGYDESLPLGSNTNVQPPYTATNVPSISSRTTYFQLGPVAFISAPGELHSELWVGYDSHWSWGKPLLDPTNTVNLPDFSRMPPAPYLRDLMLANPGVRYTFVAGLTEDFVGYIVASLNYALDPSQPYLAEAAGDHYEETNSIGPRVEEQIQHPMMDLVRWRAPTP